MGAIVDKIIKYLLSTYAKKIFDAVFGWIIGLIDGWRQSSIDKKNREKLEEALNKGSDDDIKRQSENTLNGDRP